MKSSEKLEVVQKKLGEITPYANNPRNNDDAVEAVAASIREFGFQQPIVTDKDGVIIVGHTRLKAAEMLGLETVPVVVADLDEDKANAYRLADNKTGEIATWDFELLDLELEGIEMDMEQFGFEIDEPEPVEITEDDFTEDVETRCKLGDLWQLGKHRLICGDSTDINVIDRLMDGVKADMVFTDPPYGVAYKVKASASDGNTISEARKNGCKNEKIQNDDSLEKAYQISVNAFSLLKNTETFYICCDWKCYATIKAAVEDAGIIPKALIVWDKGGPYQHLDLFAKRHEFIIYAGKYGGEKTVDTDIWSFPREFRSDHPTPKPIELIAHAIKCQKNIENVLDIFGGSGSTLIACEQLNRKCYMCELDSHYCDVIIQRWENSTGEKAELITA